MAIVVSSELLDAQKATMGKTLRKMLNFCMFNFSGKTLHALEAEKSRTYNKIW
jgi:hypothetical protein